MPNLKLSENSDEALMINDFHSVALQAMNDPKGWKTLKPEQQAIAKEWADKYGSKTKKKTRKKRK